MHTAGEEGCHVALRKAVPNQKTRTVVESNGGRQKQETMAGAWTVQGLGFEMQGCMPFDSNIHMQIDRDVDINHFSALD